MNKYLANIWFLSQYYKIERLMNTPRTKFHFECIQNDKMNFGVFFDDLIIEICLYGKHSPKGARHLISVISGFVK